MEEQTDFDPTTEEGQQDINKDLDDDEYKALIKDDDESVDSWRRRQKEKYGTWFREKITEFRNKFRSLNPGKQIPEYMLLPEDIEMQILPDPPGAVGLSQQLDQEKLKELYPNYDVKKLDVQSDLDGNLQVKLRDTFRGKRGHIWHNLFQLTDGSKLNNHLPKGIKKALGDPNQRLQLEGVENQLYENREELNQEEAEREEIQGQLETAPPEEIAKLRQLLAEKDTEIARLKTQIEDLIAEKQRILQKTKFLEDQLEQLLKEKENLMREIDELRKAIRDGNLTEEQLAIKERELEEKEERLAELDRQIENLERELGLTTKEKIKRALLKYGVPLAFAVAVSSAVGVIIYALKGVGAGVKKIGQGLANLGKKMAASIPGLLGTVISLVLKTGGELLKFVGNNIWILVVAIGAILLKRLR